MTDGAKLERPLACHDLRFAGAEQPAHRSLGIVEIESGSGCVPVEMWTISLNPFVRLLGLARSDVALLQSLLVVPPPSGHFAILLRDLVLGLLPDFRLYAMDWTNVRYVPLSEGRLHFDPNITLVLETIRRLGPRPSVSARAGTPLSPRPHCLQQPAAPLHILFSY
jgi:poly(3-hydroxybutyrate) depolymerase